MGKGSNKRFLVARQCVTEGGSKKTIIEKAQFESRCISRLWSPCGEKGNTYIKLNRLGGEGEGERDSWIKWII